MIRGKPFRLPAFAVGTQVFMARNEEEIQTLRKEILERETELALLKRRLSRAEGLLENDALAVRNGRTGTPPEGADLASHLGVNGHNAARATWSWPLSREEYGRYGRQMITPQIGLEGKPIVSCPSST